MCLPVVSGYTFFEMPQFCEMPIFNHKTSIVQKYSEVLSIVLLA